MTRARRGNGFFPVVSGSGFRPCLLDESFFGVSLSLLDASLSLLDKSFFGASLSLVEASLSLLDESLLGASLSFVMRSFFASPSRGREPSLLRSFLPSLLLS